MAYILKRLAMTIPILFLVSVMTFSLIHLIPGDPIRVILGEEASQETYDALRTQLGFDRPLVVQYFSWLGRVLQGDLGQSITDHVPVMDLIGQRIMPTIQLALGSFAVAILIAFPAGILAVVRRGRALDYFCSLGGLAGMSIPSFWLSMMLIIFFAVQLQWLPASGYTPFSVSPWQNITALLLPCLATGLRESAVLMRMLRASLLEVVNQDYIRTAKAKGVSEAGLIIKHALRNALIPVVTASGLIMAGLLGGLVITESIFSIPGFGRLIIESVFKRDYVTVQGAILVSAIMVVLVNVLVDILYAVIDPRVKLDQA